MSKITVFKRPFSAEQKIHGRCISELLFGKRSQSQAPWSGCGIGGADVPNDHDGCRQYKWTDRETVATRCRMAEFAMETVPSFLPR